MDTAADTDGYFIIFVAGKIMILRRILYKYKVYADKLLYWHTAYQSHGKELPPSSFLRSSFAF